MTTIATLAVKLTGDISEYRSAMTEAVSASQKTAEQIGKNLERVGERISSMGQMATKALTLPLIAAGGYMVNAASSLEESRNKVQVVFGDMSQSILDWSKTAATAFGQSQQQALEAAGTYGNLFTALGLGQQPAAEMSMSLVQLASDLASFNNANPQDVLNALRSGLSGEVEPLKRFGIAMNEAILKQKAMELGMEDNIQALSEAQKLQLRYAIIMEQTATAQGDFARTSDGLANSMRTMKAQLTDAAAALGEQLLPYALQFVNWAREMLAKFQALSPEQQKWIVIIGAIAAGIGPLLMIIGSLVSAIGAIIPVVTAVGAALMGPLGIALAVIAGLVALLYFAWTNNWGGIREKTAAALEWLKGAFAAGVEFIQGVWAGLQPAIETVLNIIRTVVEAWQAAFNGDWYRFGQLMRQAWDMAWTFVVTAVKNAGSNLRSALATLVNNAINYLKSVNWGEVGRNIVQGIANGITAAIDWIIAAVITMGQAVLDAIRGFLGISSPSKVMANLVGKNMALGVVKGWNDNLEPLAFRPAIGAVTGLGGTRGTIGEGDGGGIRLVNYGTLIIKTDGDDVQKDILRQLR